VTPPDIALWAKVSSLDLSAKEDGVAYAAIDGHRIDDFQPHVCARATAARAGRRSIRACPAIISSAWCAPIR
jgi:hypothetical protein